MLTKNFSGFLLKIGALFPTQLRKNCQKKVMSDRPLPAITAHQDS
jgi:hypothetical protein